MLFSSFVRVPPGCKENHLGSTIVFLLFFFGPRCPPLRWFGRATLFFYFYIIIYRPKEHSLWISALTRRFSYGRYFLCKIILESEILCCIFVSLLNISDFDFARLVKCRTKCRPPLRQYQRICDSSEPALSARSSKHSIRFVMLEKKLSHFMPCPPARILERHPLYMTSDSLGWTSPEGVFLNTTRGMCYKGSPKVPLQDFYQLSLTHNINPCR